MQPYFLDSTAVIDLFLKDEASRERVKKHVSSELLIITSQYVIYEVKRGFIQNLIYLYNRSLLTETLGDLLAYISSQSPHKGHQAGTQLGAVISFLSQGSTGNNFTHLKQIRAYLKGQIRRSIAKLNLISLTPNKISCRQVDPPRHEPNVGYIHDRKTRLCGKVSCCSVKKYFQTFLQDFNDIKSSLSAITTKDSETEKRISGMSELLQNPNNDFKRSSCWRSGDAIICHEAPPTHSILTSNHKHFLPIAKALNKSLTTY